MTAEINTNWTNSHLQKLTCELRPSVPAHLLYNLSAQLFTEFYSVALL